MEKIVKVLQSIFQLLYPQNCLHCGWDLFQHESVLCMRCLNELPVSTIIKNHPHVKKVFYGRCQWEELWIFLKMEKSGPVREALHELKYRKCPQIGERLGQWWANQIQQRYGKPNWDLIVTVPLTKSKLAQRGYNQCDAIAQPLADMWNIPFFPDAMIRKNGSISQTMKSRISRNINTENPFEVAFPELLKGKHILLVDDVITTGATLVQCFEVLNEIEGVRISMAALAIPVHNRLVV